MKQFGGFPARMQFTPVPSIFFSQLLPDIDDIAELKATLLVFWLIYNKRGYPRFASYPELASNARLVSGLAGDVLGKALDMSAARGTILRFAMEKDGATADIYFLNTESDRKAIARIQSGEIKLPGLANLKPTPAVEAAPEPDIFTLYEQNIGMLTPMVAEELREADKIYPEAWVRDAIKEAVNQNKRKWSYISAILERWTAEGRSDGTYQRDFRTALEKYAKQKYGHMVQH